MTPCKNGPYPAVKTFSTNPRDDFAAERHKTIAMAKEVKQWSTAQPGT